MSNTCQHDHGRIYRPTDPKLVERFSMEVANQLNDSLLDKESRSSFARDLSTLLSLAARIKARYLNNQCEKTATMSPKGEI